MVCSLGTLPIAGARTSLDNMLDKACYPSLLRVLSSDADQQAQGLRRLLFRANVTNNGLRDLDLQANAK